MPEKVAIIGNGSVGSALEQGLRRAGREVQTVGREPGRVRELARWGEVIVLAVPFGERANALAEMGDGARGKVLVDVTNAVTPAHDFAARFDRSGAEELQGMARGARVVKAFNTVFAKHMASGQALGEPLTVFAAGDDEEARRKVMGLAADLGFDAVDAGPLRNARWLEAMGFLNIQLGVGQGLGGDIGFRLVRPGAPAARREAGAAAARGR